MKVVFASLLMASAFSSAAFATPVIKAQSCVNPSRGIILMLPEISNGQLAGPLKVTRLIRTLVEVPASSVTGLRVSDEGLLAFYGKDSNGQAVKVTSTTNEHGKLIVQVQRKDLGMIGFTCGVLTPAK